MGRLEEKAKFLLEIVNGKYHETIRDSAREALNLMGISNPQIEEYRERKLFVNQLHEDNNHSEDAYGYSVKDKSILNKTSFLVAMLIITLVIFGFVIIIKDTPNKNTQVIEESIQSVEGGKAL